MLSNKDHQRIEILVRQKKGPQKPSQYRVDANIVSEQKKIIDNLGLNVTIQNKKNNSGKITILYKNLEQFEYLANLLKRNQQSNKDQQLSS